MYEAAPLEAFHESVGLVDTPVAPFAGELSVGAAGGGGGGPDTTTEYRRLLTVPEGTPVSTFGVALAFKAD